MATAFRALIAVLISVLSMNAFAEYAGVVKTTKGSVFVERAGTQVPVSPGVQLNQGDRIVTGSTGYVGITMRDDTLLTLGPGSAMNLEAFEFDAKTHDGNFLAYLSRGVLSVVTGLIPKRSPDAFVVRTRISTMGVRGTEFIVEAHEE